MLRLTLPLKMMMMVNKDSSKDGGKSSAIYVGSIAGLRDCLDAVDKINIS